VPALLSVFGAKITWSPSQTVEDGFFGRLARKVQRRPVIAAAGVTVILLLAGAPFLSANYGMGDPRVLPTSVESRQVADTLTASFQGEQAEPVQVIGRVADSDPRVTAYVDHLRTLPGVAAVELETGLRGGVTAIDVIPSGRSQDSTAQDLVRTLRADRPTYQSYVSGQAAFLLDFKHLISQRLPWAAGLIALTTFILLFLMTGSVLIPIKALVMNTLSLAATFGALIWVFQQGHLSGLLNFDAFGAIEIWVPIVVFAFAFGLSMDYEIFLLSRIKERYDETGNNDEAVATGLQRSGRIITSAALLVTIVFLGFAAGKHLGIKEMGLALAVAVVVDATLIRCVLVPATMTLLGDANWWAPKPLRAFHARFGLHEAPTVIDLTVPGQRAAETTPQERKHATKRNADA
jgi:RND superfamily putative drug exporter